MIRPTTKTWKTNKLSTILQVTEGGNAVFGGDRELDGGVCDYAAARPILGGGNDRQPRFQRVGVVRRVPGEAEASRSAPLNG